MGAVKQEEHNSAQHAAAAAQAPSFRMPSPESALPHVTPGQFIRNKLLLLKEKKKNIKNINSKRRTSLSV
jgi:hypothetical protein